MRVRTLLCAGILLWVAVASSGDPRPVSEPGPGKAFLYTAKKLGLPILKASLHIENGPPSQGKPLVQVRMEISSVNLGFLFRINNRFTSTMESDTCMPIQYIKEIDQDGLFKENKNYLETLTFDPRHQRVWVERKGGKEKREVSLPPETFDPLSMFARCYLKETLHPSREIRMSIFDGMKLRQIVFHPRQEKIKSKVFGEVDTVCIEATTFFASFEDREGTIRIWYTNDGRKIPLVMELDLPVGSIRFELDEAKEG